MNISTNQKIVILTGGDLRHKFFIHHLNTRFPISEIYIEINKYPKPNPKTVEESIAWDWFFKERDHSEKELVLKSSRLPKKNKPKTTYLKNGELNSLNTIAKIAKISPGFIAVFGTNILNKLFLQSFPDRIFNLHIGDPEFYRGSSCNFWPIYHEKLQHMSATIHRVDQGIDTGDILYRQAITINAEDNEQSLLLKPLKLGADLMVEAIQSWQNETLQTIPHSRNGKLFKKSDLTPKVILKMKQMVESGRLNDCIRAQAGLTGNNTAPKIKREETKTL